MQAALELIFTLSLAGVTWSGALIALIASRTAVGQQFWAARWMIGLHILALIGGALTLGAVIGEQPYVAADQVTFPPMIKWAGILQWTPFVGALILLAFIGFTPETAAKESHRPTQE